MSARAFDLVPAIERISIGDKLSSIESLECSDTHLYIGTKDSQILLYHLEDKVQANGSIHFFSRQRNQVHLGFKKAVRLMKAASLLKQLLVLCDGCLTILHMTTLEAFPHLSKLRGVAWFCLNENPSTNNPFILELCIARKKQIQLYHLSEERLVHVKDFSLPEAPLKMCMDGSWLCIATATKYLAFNLGTGSLQELYLVNPDHSPIIQRITREEFLITGPSGLGIFINVAGISERPPLLWGEGIVAVAYSHPYILVLSQQFLTIYNILDQQAKQSIPFTGGSCLDNFDGKILVTSTNVICALLPIPWDKQIQSLLLDKQVEEALELVKYASKSTLPKEQTEKLVRRVYQQSGFIKLFEGSFDQAMELFLQSELDPREVVRLFPGLLPSTSNYTRVFPPLHDLASIDDVVTLQGLTTASAFKTFLLRFLEAIRNPDDSSLVNSGTLAAPEDTAKASNPFLDPGEEMTEANPFFEDTTRSEEMEETNPFSESDANYNNDDEGDDAQKEIDTVLLKLQVELDVDKSTLLSFLRSPDTRCDLREASQFLSSHHLYHALATYLHTMERHEEALSIWVRLLSGDYKDPMFEGLPFFVDILATLPEPGLVWRHMDTVLELDQMMAVEVFIRRPQKDLETELFRPETALDFLQRHPLAQIKYLEYLIHDLRLEKEKFHTHLAVLLIDRVVRLNNSKPRDEALIQQERAKLQSFISESSLYRIHLVLGKARDNRLLMECSILYGKLEEHEKALKVLVHELADYQAAQDYCLKVTGRRSREYQHRVFHILLSVYLDPEQDAATRESMLPPALELLNSELADFDAIKVLQLLPPQWPLCRVFQFLTKSLRQSYHRRTTTLLERGLCHGESLTVSVAKLGVERTSVHLTDHSVCGMCHGPFFEAEFVRLPSGSVVHPKCNTSTRRLNNHSRSPR